MFALAGDGIIFNTFVGTRGCSLRDTGWVPLRSHWKQAHLVAFLPFIKILTCRTRRMHAYSVRGSCTMKSLYSAQHVTARSRCTVGSHKAHVIYRHEMFRLDKKREAKSFFLHGALRLPKLCTNFRSACYFYFKLVYFSYFFGKATVTLRIPWKGLLPHSISSKVSGVSRTFVLEKRLPSHKMKVLTWCLW